MTDEAANAPDWDIEQLEVILEEPSAWQLVISGPGTGKSAVACQRVACLVDEGTPPPRILLVSFTRTAVAELRDRIVSYCVAGERARGVRISTLDSYAWSLRSGFEVDVGTEAFRESSFDLSIANAVQLFRDGNPDLLDFMDRVEHLIVDEAQDILGVRADLVIEMIRSVNDTCGVTILADPNQAIYGFTTDEDSQASGDSTLLSRLESESPRHIERRELSTNYRIQDARLEQVFSSTREEVEANQDHEGYVERMLKTIKENDVEHLGARSYEAIAGALSDSADQSVLVLFRRRADVLFASSYCSGLALGHRLRISGTPTVMHPWLGWLFNEYESSHVNRPEFEELWHRRSELAPEPFQDIEASDAWSIIRQLAAAQEPDRVDLVQLRGVLSRRRPPVELCFPDLGTEGPVLGTIHASKGREAETVVLVMPTGSANSRSKDVPAAQFEEGRVYYVGATRARKALVVADNSATPVSYLDSRRIFRKLGPQKVQFELGRDGDVDRFAHLAWSNRMDIQHVLAKFSSANTAISAQTRPDEGFVIRLVLEYEPTKGTKKYLDIAQMGESFQTDWNRLWSARDPGGRLRPPSEIPNIYLIGASTVVLSEDERQGLPSPFRNSGFALMPIVKGFSTVLFPFRRTRSWR